MGYLSILNLYKDQTVLLFKELYALEKLHGTSAHAIWQPCTNGDERAERLYQDVVIPKQQGIYHNDRGYMILFSGGAPLANFEKLVPDLLESFAAFGTDQRIEVYGELYGGSQQKQSHRYGPNLKFCVFDVKIGNTWLQVPNAEDVATKLGLEFVAWQKIPGTVEACDNARDFFSVQAKRNGVETPQYMEGVVLRPIVEMVDSRGSRVIAKHKRPEERETATDRKVIPADKQQILSDAAAIANEWVTEMRLDHVLGKMPPETGIEKTGEVTKAMVEDVLREAAGEIIDSKEARNAISAKARILFRARIKKV